MSRSNFLAMHLSSLLAFQAPESRALPSTQSLPKANVVMLNPFRHMPDSSWVRWINLMSILLKAYHLQSLSTRNLQIETRGQRLEQSQRSTTTLDCSSRVPAGRTAQIARRQYHVRAHNKLLIKFLLCLQQQSFRSWLQLSASVRASSLTSLQSS